MLGQLIRALADTTEGIIPRWAWPAAIFVLAASAWPSIRRSTRADAARKHFRTATRHPYAERVAREDEAVERVADNPDGLLSLAELAIAEGRPRVVAGILERLRASGKHPEQVRKLARTLDVPLPGSAMEAVILIERFWAQGQADEARRRLQRARERWPNDEELAALDRQFSPPVDADPGTSRE